MKRFSPQFKMARSPRQRKGGCLALALMTGLFLQGMPEPLQGQTWIGADGTGGDGAWNAANFGLASGPSGGSGGHNLVLDGSLSGHVADAAITLSGTANRAKSVIITNGKKVEWKMASDSLLAVSTGAIGLGTGQANELTISGPESGTATVTATRITLHGGSANYGTSQRTLVTLSGAGLTFRTTSTDLDSSSNRGIFLVTGGATYDKSAGKFHIYSGNAVFDNQLVIEDGKMMARDITVRGLMQVGRDGIIDGVQGQGEDAPIPLAITVERESGATFGGRFEAEGSGIGSLVEMTLRNQGVFAVGLSNGLTGAAATSAATLELDGKVTFESGSILELDVFGEEAFDKIKLGVNGALSNSGAGARLVLNLHDYTPQAGDVFELFELDPLNPAAISGAFDLSLLNAELWDLSGFNNEGGWKIVAIPEPQAFTLLVGVAGAFWLARRRRI